MNQKLPEYPPGQLLKIQPGNLFIFVDGEIIGMVEAVDFKNKTVSYKEWDGTSQRLINKTKTGEIIFAINKNEHAS